MRPFLLHTLSALLFAGHLAAQQPEEKKQPAVPPEPAKPAEKAPETPAAAKPKFDPEAAAARDKAAEEFRKMSMEYRLAVIESMKRFQARDFTGAISFADKADLLQAPTVWTLNVRGAVAIEQRRFAEGEDFCKTALKIDPNFFPAKFNLCEIPFLQGKYVEARTTWEELLANYPVNPAMKNSDGTPELLTYRIFLCLILEKNRDQAKVWLDKIPFPSMTPAYHYGNAVWERDAGNEEKWKEWIEQAEFIWPEVKRANFTDVLIQLGWVKPPFEQRPPAK